jgi:predicted PurR-regulated permease PerM
MMDRLSFRDHLEGGWTRQRVIFLAVSFAFVLAVLVWSKDVLLPFVLAGIIAYVLTPFVALCERWKIGRAASILIVYLSTLSVLSVSVALMAPRLYQESLGLVRASPTIARKLASQWGPILEDTIQEVFGPAPETPQSPPETGSALELHPSPDGGWGLRVGTGLDIVRVGPSHWRVFRPEQEREAFSVERLLSDGLEGTVVYLKTNALELIRLGQTILSRLTRGVFLGFMTLMVAGYLMHTRDQVVEFFRSLVAPTSRNSFDRLLWRIDRGLAGVVRGQLLICAVNGVLSAIGFALFHLDYWPVLSLIACVLSIIPIFGSILSTVPAVIIGLTQDVWTALWVLIWILAIHQLEANLFNPKIIGVTARLHPVLVVFVLIVGEHFFGLWGALLAVPCLSLFQSFFNHFRLDAMPDSPPSMRAPELEIS